jgi:hypothetical protein
MGVEQRQRLGLRLRRARRGQSQAQRDSSDNDGWTKHGGISRRVARSPSFIRTLPNLHSKNGHLPMLPEDTPAAKFAASKPGR